jgi:hypothetical protein
VRYQVYYSQSPPLMATAEEALSGGRARDLDDRSDQRIGIRPRRPAIPSVRSSSLRDDQATNRRISIGRRMLRAFARFFIAVLIGVGATLAWQSYGDVAKGMVAARVPALAWLLSVSTTKPPVVAATPPDPMPKLESLASNLDDMRRSVEQLAAKQEQMAQNIVALQAVEEDIRQKMSSTPPPPPQQAASTPQPKAPQSRAQPPAVQSSSVSRPTSPTGSAFTGSALPSR